MAPGQDILVELTQRELHQILCILKSHLPKHIRMHNYIFNYLLHYDKLNNADQTQIYADHWKVRFYRHRFGNIENCTIIGLTGEKDYCVSTFTLEKTPQELVECLQKTKLIDWDCSSFSLNVDEQNFNFVKDVVCTKRNDWQYLHPELIMYMPQEKIHKLELPSIPVNLYMGPLKPTHAELINENWPYKCEGSVLFIKQCIELNGGLALFRKDTQQPIAWIATSDFFAPSFLNTIPTERRKGHGSTVLTYELKRLAERHHVDLFTFVVTINKASLELHRELGFTPVNKFYWIVK